MKTQKKMGTSNCICGKKNGKTLDEIKSMTGDRKEWKEYANENS